MSDFKKFIGFMIASVVINFSFGFDFGTREFGMITLMFFISGIVFTFGLNYLNGDNK